MFEAVLEDGGRSSVSELARRVEMPIATAHRQIATLVKAGYLMPSGSGRHIAGPKLRGLIHLIDDKQIVANVAGPALDKLASRIRSVVQLGTFENDMVTYRIKAGRGASDLFTKVGMQLEAYCSGIGKVLLAHLPEKEREHYLAGGPFVALTPRTITDPARLREELDRVHAQAFATDDEEIAPGLRCMAVPIRKADGTVIAAISVSQDISAPSRTSDDALLALMRDTAATIERDAFSQDG